VSSTVARFGFRLRRNVIGRRDDISASDAEIQNDACDAGGRHQPSNLRRTLGQEVARIRLAGACGIALELSHYPVSESKAPGE
jgi:hypothetical protein